MICAFSIIFVVNKDITLFKVLGAVDHFNYFLMLMCCNEILYSMLIEGTVGILGELGFITPGSPPDSSLGNILEGKDSLSSYTTFFDSCFEENRHEINTIVVNCNKI